MSVTVKEVREMTISEIFLYAKKFTEDYLIFDGWSKTARKLLYKRYDDLLKIGLDD